MCSLNPCGSPSPHKHTNTYQLSLLNPPPSSFTSLICCLFFFILISLFFVTICLASPLFLFLHPDMITISHYPHPLCLPDQLAINFKFTFNESEPELVNITKENLLIKPVSTRSDIDFELEVFQPVLLRITFYSCEFQGIFYLFLRERNSCRNVFFLLFLKPTDELLMNFKYTFQLDDTSGENLTKINLYVQPSVQNRDIEFILNVNEPVNFTISYTTSEFAGLVPPQCSILCW